MGKTILIVEDEQNIVDILSFNLSREGYDTLEAYDGPTGLQLALEQNPDLILLDLMLPGMNGFDVCRKVRHDPVAGNFLPVHAVIGTTMRDEFIQFDKRPLIQQHFNPLARCHPACFMPLAQLVLAAAKFRLAVTAFKFLIYPFVILFHGYPIRFAKHPV